MKSTSLSLATFLLLTSSFALADQATGTLKEFRCMRGRTNPVVVSSVTGEVGTTVSIEKMKSLITDNKGNVKSGFGFMESASKLILVLPSVGQAESACDNGGEPTSVVVEITKN